VFSSARFCRIADGPDEVHMSQLGKLRREHTTLEQLGQSHDGHANDSHVGCGKIVI